MNNKKILAIDITTLVKWNRPPVGIIRTQLEFVHYTLQNDSTALFFRFNDNKDDLFQISTNEVQNIVTNLLNFQNITIKTNKKTAINLQNQAKKNFTKKIYFIYKSEGLKALFVRFCKRFCPLKMKNLVKNIYFRFFFNSQKDHNILINETLNNAIYAPEIDLANSCTPSFLNKNTIIVSMGLDWDYSNYPLLYWLKRKIGFNFVGTFYDAIPITHPQYVQSHNFSQMFFSHIYYLLHLSDRIFCISGYSKKTLEEICNLHHIDKKAKFKTIYLGDTILKEIKLKKQYQRTHKKEYILYVSTVEARKNHKLLLDVWQILTADKNINVPDLLFVGMMGWGTDEVRKTYENDEKLQKVVYFYENVNDEELSQMYSNAKFTLFPSFVEGWGLAAVESLSYGTPCIISDAPALIEATQGLMPSINANDAAAWAKMIKLLITDEQKLNTLKKSIKENFKTRSWYEFSQDFFFFAKDAK